MFKKAKNILKVEILLEAMNVRFEKRNDMFVIYDNKYINNQKTFTELYLHVTKDGVYFEDKRSKPITNIEYTTEISNVKLQLLNIYGLLSNNLLVTK